MHRLFKPVVAKMREERPLLGIVAGGYAVNYVMTSFFKGAKSLVRPYVPQEWVEDESSPGCSSIFIRRPISRK